MIDRYDFWARPLALRRMMDRLFEDAFVLPAGEQGARPSNRALNVYQEGEQLVVEAELPGIKPEDIDVSVEHGILTIRGQSRADEERKERRYVVREQRSASFARSLRLPDTVDVDGARARFEHGVLRLTFPRSAQADPHRVPIATPESAAIGAAPNGAADASTSPSSRPSGAEPSAPTAHAPAPPDGTPVPNGPASEEAASRTARKRKKATGEPGNGRKATGGTSTRRKAPAGPAAVGASA